MTIIDAQTIQFTLGYNEPVLSADGSTLHDLKQTNINYTKNGVPQPAIVVPATSLAGGGRIDYPLTLALAENESATFTFTVTAQDLTGNISTPNVLSTTVDRVAPQPVTSFSLA